MEGLYSCKHCSTPGPINSWRSRRVDGVAWEMLPSLATSLPLGFRSQQLLFLRNLLPTTCVWRNLLLGFSQWMWVVMRYSWSWDTRGILITSNLSLQQSLVIPATGTRFTVSGESSKVPLYQSKYAPEFPCACIWWLLQCSGADDTAQSKELRRCFRLGSRDSCAPTMSSHE
jgi:hypothetical protein